MVKQELLSTLKFAQANARKGTIHKVLPLKFGDFQTPAPHLYAFKQ